MVRIIPYLDFFHGICLTPLQKDIFTAECAENAEIF